MFLPYISSFQNGLNHLLTPSGSVFMLNDAEGYTRDIAKCIGKSHIIKNGHFFPVPSIFWANGSSNWGQIWSVPSNNWYLGIYTGDFWNFHFRAILGTFKINFWPFLGIGPKNWPFKHQKWPENENFKNPLCKFLDINYLKVLTKFGPNSMTH